MKSTLRELGVLDTRATDGVIEIIAEFEGGKRFTRLIEQPFSMDEVGKALYHLATDIMRAALSDPPGILNIT